MNNKIALINPGTQYTQQFVWRFKELGYPNILDIFDVSLTRDKEGKAHPSTTKVTANDVKDYNGIIIAGSWSSVYDTITPDIDKAIATLPQPTLGVCYGMQWLAHVLGGKVRNGRRQYGEDTTQISPADPLFKEIEDNDPHPSGPPQIQVCMSHGDHVDTLPHGFNIIASSTNLLDNSPFTDAMSDLERKIWGVQFHHEVYLTTQGAKILDNFAHICGIETPKTQVAVGTDIAGGVDFTGEKEERTQYIKDRVGTKRIIAPVSGGVDSSVALALVYAAGIQREKIKAFHIDTGYNRRNESRDVVEAYKAMGWDVELIDASGDFYNFHGGDGIPLKDVINNKQKRNLFQQAYAKVIRDIITRYKLDKEQDIVLQGTLEADNVESGQGKGSSGSANIKTHHNVGGPLSEFQSLTPNDIYFKKQVRELGKLLGLPESITARLPFPGPGLLVRIVGHQGMYQQPSNDIEQVQNQANIVAEKFGNTVYVCPDLEFVGTMGDDRKVGKLAIIHYQEKPDWDKLRKLANQLPWYTVGDAGTCITRVAVALNPLVTTEQNLYTETRSGPAEVYQLQEIDAICREAIKENPHISQEIISLLALNNSIRSTRTAMIRYWRTPDFMTGENLIPGVDFKENILTSAKRIILDRRDTSLVLYELLSKPCSTTEPH